MRPPPCVLTIAGSDSGAGAGIQADIRAIQVLGGYAVTAVTAVTAQTGRGIAAWRAVSPALIGAQVAAVLRDCPVAAIKTGLLPGPAAVREVARALAGSRTPPLVVDPVAGSTSGTRFLSARGLAVLKRELLPRATLITPNWPEAEALSGLPVRSEAGAEAAARSLARELGCAVLVKGGHGRGPACRDCLARPGGRVRWYAGVRIDTLNTHGTGCVLSAAIALGLARGRGLEEAVGQARGFLEQALRSGRGVRWPGGAGPALS